MSKLLKILLITAGIIVVVLVIGYFSIRAYLTPERICYIATKVTSEAIQLPVEFGKVGLRIGFTIGITIDDVSMPNVKGFSPGPMIQIEKTTLNLRLLPLVRRQIVIGGIGLSGMKLNLERNQEGTLNIATIVPKEMKGTGWSFSLASIDLFKSEIRYIDAKDKIEIKIKGINQSVIFNGNKTIVSGKQEVYIARSKTLPEMVIKINNHITYDSLKKSVHIKKLSVVYESIYLDMEGTVENMKTLRINADLKVNHMSKLLKLIPAGSRPEQLKGTLKADLSVLGTLAKPKVDGRCELKNVSIAPKGVNRAIEKIHGSVSFDQNAIRNIILQGRIGKTKFDVNGSITNLKDPQLNIVAKIDGNLRDFESITDELEGVKMSGPLGVTITVKGTAKNPSYFGDYTIKDGRIDGIGIAKPITHLYIKGSIQNDAAQINRCSGHIGRSDFSFNGHISNFKKPVIQISNKSNTIDLDELLPKPQKGKKEAGKPVPLTLKGNVRINTLTGMEMEFKNINTNFTYENGIVDLKNCEADAFDGNVSFDFYYNSNKPEPYRITARMTSISTKKILKRFLKFENLEGRLTGMSNFQGRGFNQKDVISNLSASGNLKVNNGKFRDFELITRLLSWLGIKGLKELKFNDLVCYFKITNGKAKITDWALTSSTGNFLTNGTIGLNGKLNLDITTTLSKHYSNIVKKYHGDWIFFFDKKGRAIIDIIVSGKLTNPKFSLNKNKIQKRIKGKIKDEFDKKKKEWENKLNDLFKGK